MLLETASNQFNFSQPAIEDTAAVTSAMLLLNLAASSPPTTNFTPHHHHHHSLTTTTTNSTPATTTEPQPRAWTGGLVAEYAIRVTLALLMVLVNLLVLVTLCSTPALRCAANKVISSLAVTDLLVGLVAPGGLLIELQVLVSPFLCRVGYAGVMALTSVSINHLLFVCVDRYLLISRPLRYHSLVTKRRVWLFIALCWVWASLLSLPFSLGLTIQPHWDGRCLAELIIPPWLVVLLAILHFLLPLIVMTYVHVAIYAVARRHQRAVKRSLRMNGGEEVVKRHGRDRGNSVTNGNNVSRDRSNSGKDANTVSDDKNVCRDRSNSGNDNCITTTTTTTSSSSFSISGAKLRAARLLVLPCGYFYLSWAPWFGTVLWAVFSGKVVEPHFVERFVQTLAILNSLGNPIVYAASQPVLGRAMWQKLKGWGRGCKNWLCCVNSSSLSASYSFTGRDRQGEASTVLVNLDRGDCTCV